MKSTNAELSSLAEVMVASPIDSDGQRHRAEFVRPVSVSAAELVRAFAEELAMGEGVSVSSLIRSALKIEIGIENVAMNGFRQPRKRGLKPRDWHSEIGCSLSHFGLQVAIRQSLGSGHRDAISMSIESVRANRIPRRRAMTLKERKDLINRLREALRYQYKNAQDNAGWRRDTKIDRAMSDDPFQKQRLFLIMHEPESLKSSTVQICAVLPGDFCPIDHA